MDALWISAGVVALAEIGDKTQLLAIVLAARFRRPVPILLGILAATLLNHAIAASLGYLVAEWLDGELFQILLGVSFIVMGRWMLIPDKPEEDKAPASGRGVFLTTLVAFFLLEIGDKTQIATSLLAARFNDIVLVTIGTTLGMMAANAPAVLIGERVIKIVPLFAIRVVSALILWATGAWIIVRALLPSYG
jgi:Ca2+/H+ antiporter, TMEM165/GDT1 family